MYPDTVLFIIGFIFAAAMLFFAAYFLSSRRRSRVYTEVLKQESERFDAITATMFMESGAASSSAAFSNANISAAATETEHVRHHYDTERLIASEVTPTGDRARETRFTGAFDPYAISAAYAIEREIGGGAMSRTFQVKNLKLGNPWFMKFIPREYGGLANEVNILKLLNHAGLPRIVDVFHREEGVYIIETLVEGVPLDKFNKSGSKASQYILIDWFEQTAQALKYLHGMRPSPIYHLDLKPGNIMVTHDNRLVLVDFGIARLFGENSVGAVTATYAAPEQFGGKIPQKYEPLINARFGGVHELKNYGACDARTDIYSLGVIMFELATGQLPVLRNLNALKNTVSDELRAIILKCIAPDPEGRYQSADKLLDDLRRVKGTKLKMARLLLTRRLAAAAASVSLLISGGTFAGGYYIYNEESAATVAAQPEIVTVSLQQSSEFSVSKHMADGRVVYVDNEQMTWEYSKDNIARIDGGRVSGINEGQTVIRGYYRNKTVALTVRVVRPVDGLTEISQRYSPGHYVELYAGGSTRVRVDGQLASADFISPESITAADDGTIYVCDAGEIRAISGGAVSTVKIPADYIKASKIRSYDSEIYILSDPWQDGDRYFYALLRLGGAGAQALYIADAMYTAVEDFCFDEDGLLYFIDRNEGLGGVFLKTLDLYDVEDIKTLCTLPPGSASVSVSSDGYAYIGNKDDGVIMVYDGRDLEYFAGIAGERAFIDGSSPRFYSPQRLQHSSGSLYIWDFNTLRRIDARRGVAGDCITLAGMASPEFDMELDDARTRAEDVVLPFGSLMDFAVTRRGVLISDPKRGVIWIVDV